MNNTSRGRSSDDDRARQGIAVIADRISSSVMGPLCFHFQLWSNFQVQRDGSAGCLGHTSGLMS